MRIACLSDMHGHYDFKLPPSDVAVFAGDLTRNGYSSEFDVFTSWLLRQDYRRAIVVPGNHDRWLAENTPGQLLGATILQDSGCYIDGALFWGFPWVRSDKSEDDLQGRPFHLSLSAYQERCRRIPSNVDVLLCHARIDPAEIPSVHPKLQVFGHRPYIRGSRSGIGANGSRWVYASATWRPPAGKATLVPGLIVAEFDVASNKVSTSELPLESVPRIPREPPQIERYFDDDEYDVRPDELPGSWSPGILASYRPRPQGKDIVDVAAERAGLPRDVWLKHRIREIALAEVGLPRTDIAPIM